MQHQEQVHPRQNGPSVGSLSSVQSRKPGLDPVPQAWSTPDRPQSSTKPAAVSKRDVTHQEEGGQRQVGGVLQQLNAVDQVALQRALRVRVLQPRLRRDDAAPHLRPSQYREKHCAFEEHSLLTTMPDRHWLVLTLSCLVLTRQRTQCCRDAGDCVSHPKKKQGKSHARTMPWADARARRVALGSEEGDREPRRARRRDTSRASPQARRPGSTPTAPSTAGASSPA